MFIKTFVATALSALGFASASDEIIAGETRNFAQDFTFTDESGILIENPVIGVLTHPMMNYFIDKQAEYGLWSSYMSDATVKWIEASGGRAVPIQYYPPGDPNYRNEVVNNWLMDRINGLVLPGGAATSSDFRAWTKGLLEKAEAINDAGSHFPVFGLCLGMQHMIQVLGASRSRREQDGTVLPMEWDMTYAELKNSKMYGGIQDDAIFDYLAQNDVAYHNHNWGIAPHKMNYSYIKNKYVHHSTNLECCGGTDRFVNSFEGLVHPFFGVQFHPERSVGAMSKFHLFTHNDQSF